MPGNGTGITRQMALMRSLRDMLIVVIVLFITLSVPVAGQTMVPSTSPSPEGIIQISSTPSGAEVLLNSTFQGYTPLEIRNVTPGPYIVTLKLQGYPDREGYIVLKPDAATIVAVNLTKGLEPTTGITPAPTKAGSSFFAVCASLIGLGFLASRRRT
jgi:hypothetical protein